MIGGDAGQRVVGHLDVEHRHRRIDEHVIDATDRVSTREGRAQAVAVATLVDRSGGQTKFSVPFVSLLELTFPTYPADQLPPELAALPATKPGS